MVENPARGTPISLGDLSSHSRDFVLECILLEMRIPLGRAGGEIGLSAGNGGIRISLGCKLLSDTGKDTRKDVISYHIKPVSCHPYHCFY